MSTNGAMGQTLHNLFLDSANRTPDAPALRTATRDWSYAELAHAAYAQAETIRRLTAETQGAVIGVVAEKKPATYATLLAVMLAGGIYLPIDPDPPPERLRAILASARPALILSPWRASEVQRVAASMRIPVVDASPMAEGDVLSLTGPPPVRPSLSEHVRYVAPDNTAYLMYTSGTTGAPKGVPITHGNAMSCLEQMQVIHPLHRTDRVLHPSDLSFDLAIAEIFLTWAAGACLVPCDPSTLPGVAALVRRCRVTVWVSVPSLASSLAALRLCPPRSLSSLRLSMFAGEPLLSHLVDLWSAAAPQSQIVNLYGPTECSIFVSSYTVDTGNAAEWPVTPLGQPFPRVDWRILPADGDRGAGEAATAGELLLGGPQLANGYWADDSLTRQKFLRDAHGRRWYRTGDAVAEVAGVGLVFAGRLDHQVKIRGRRIELAEVSSAISRVSGSPMVASVPLCGPDGSYVGIATYCTGLDGDARTVLRRASEYLPRHMFPQRLEVLSDWPLLANGKTDVARLFRMANCGAGVWHGARFTEGESASASTNRTSRERR